MRRTRYQPMRSNERTVASLQIGLPYAHRDKSKVRRQAHRPKRATNRKNSNVDTREGPAVSPPLFVPTPRFAGKLSFAQPLSIQLCHFLCLGPSSAFFRLRTH